MCEDSCSGTVACRDADIDRCGYIDAATSMRLHRDKMVGCRTMWSKASIKKQRLKFLLFIALDNNCS